MGKLKIAFASVCAGILCSSSAASVPSPAVPALRGPLDPAAGNDINFRAQREIYGGVPRPLVTIV